MVGADPGLALRLSILLCMRELLTGLSRARGGGSEKGLSDAVRICGGGMMGMMDPVGLGWEDEKLLRLCFRRWRTKTASPTRTDAAKTTARMDIPVIKDLETPVALPAAPLDDAAFAVPAAEDDGGCCSTGIEVFVARSSVDVEDPVPLAALLEAVDVDGALLDV